MSELSGKLHHSRKHFLREVEQKEPLLADLVTRMLEFNPYLRMTASELTDHPFFSEIRLKQNEVNCASKLLLDIDKDESYDPLTSKFTQSPAQLGKTIYDIILKHQGQK